MPSVPADEPALTWPAKLAEAARDIKLAHSAFALPFALLGAFLAIHTDLHAVVRLPVPHAESFQSPESPPLWLLYAGPIFLIILCMVAARSFAMLANRYLDRDVDAENPRTIRRAFAAGRLSPRDGIVLMAVSAGAFHLGTVGFWVVYDNWLPVIAGPFVLGWLAFYSYTKRFSALCHLVLGMALALSPIAAAAALGGVEAVRFWPWTGGAHDIAIGHSETSRPGWFDGTADLYLLAAFIACWVAGFDVIYAMQDEAFDRDRGLHSIPAKLGTRGATWTSRALHTLALACLVLAGSVSDRFGVFFTIATALTAGLLITEHAVLAKRGHAGIPMAFFTLNGVIAIVLGAAGIADVVTG